MEILDICLIVGIILVGVLLFKKQLKEVEINKDKLINDVIMSNTDISLLKTQNELKEYLITYRDKMKGIKTEIICASNKTEAEALFCLNSGISNFKIISIK